MEKKVSIYFNSFVKSALERETLYHKSVMIDGPRSTIYKNIEFILKDFISKYRENIEDIKELIYNSLNKDIEDVNKDDFKKQYDHDLTAYPILINDEVLETIEEIRNKINDELGIKFNKIYFFNFIILNYFMENKSEILKRELDFWEQPYFKNGKR